MPPQSRPNPAHHCHRGGEEIAGILYGGTGWFKPGASQLAENHRLAQKVSQLMEQMCRLSGVPSNRAQYNQHLSPDAPGGIGGGEYNGEVTRAADLADVGSHN